jgi:hypothetical protein
MIGGVGRSGDDDGGSDAAAAGGVTMARGGGPAGDGAATGGIPDGSLTVCAERMKDASCLRVASISRERPEIFESNMIMSTTNAMGITRRKNISVSMRNYREI